jgi:hypothetical protein
MKKALVGTKPLENLSRRDCLYGRRTDAVRQIAFNDFLMPEHWESVIPSFARNLFFVLMGLIRTNWSHKEFLDGKTQNLTESNSLFYIYLQ